MDGEKIKGALLERALGYDADEVVEEYGFSEGEAVLVKRKVTKKRVPPDIQAAKMLLDTGCDFLMVGRGAMGAPWIFSQINAYLKDGTVIPEPPLKKRMLILIDQVSRMVRYKGEKVAMMEARQHAAWYMRGLSGAANLRRLCGEIKSMDDVLNIVRTAINNNPEL